MDSDQNYEAIFRKFDKKNQGAFDFFDYFLVSKTIRQEYTEKELKEAFDLMD